MGLLVGGIGPFHDHSLLRLTQKYSSFSRLAGFQSQNSEDCAILSQRALFGLLASILVGNIDISVIVIVDVVIIIATTTTTTIFLTSHSYLYNHKTAPYSQLLK